jgi:hypothetical protein
MRGVHIRVASLLLTLAALLLPPTLEAQPADVTHLFNGKDLSNFYT